MTENEKDELTAKIKRVGVYVAAAAAVIGLGTTIYQFAQYTLGEHTKRVDAERKLAELSAGFDRLEGIADSFEREFPAVQAETARFAVIADSFPEIVAKVEHSHSFTTQWPIGQWPGYENGLPADIQQNSDIEELQWYIDTFDRYIHSNCTRQHRLGNTSFDCSDLHRPLGKR